MRPYAITQAVDTIGAVISCRTTSSCMHSGLVLSRKGWKRFPPSATRGVRFPLEVAADGRFDCVAGLRMWRRARRARYKGSDSV